MLSKILSINIGRGVERLLAIQSLALKEGIQIILVQEPPAAFNQKNILKNPFATNWNLYYNSNTSRAITMVAKQLPPIQQLPSPNDNIIIVNINGTILINIYQPPTETEAIHDLGKIIEEYSTSHPIVIAGDFNARHSHWDHATNKQGIVTANLIREKDFTLLTEPYTPTFHHFNGLGSSTIDLVIANNRAERLILSATTMEDRLDVHSDHLPILIEAQKATRLTPFIKTIRNWKTVDWDVFNKNLALNLKEELRPLTLDNCPTKNDLNSHYEQLTKSIQSTIESTVETARICEKSKIWWNEHLTTLRDTTTKARRMLMHAKKQYPSSTNKFLRRYHRRRKEFQNAIHIAKRQYAIGKISTMDEAAMWKYVRDLNNPIAPPTIPILRDANGTCHSDTATKTKLLVEKFFPLDNKRQFDANTWAMPNTYQSNTLHPDVSLIETHAAVMSMDAESSPGTDGIPNKVIQQCWTTLACYIHPLTHWCLHLGHHPSEAKVGKAIALKKPNRHGGHNVGDYRPITMLNSIAKVVEKVATRRLIFWLETSGKLPPEQYGFRPTRDCEQAIATLIDNIRKGWKSNKVTSTVFLDVKGAYDTVRHSKLLDKLCSIGVPAQFIHWIASFLSNRCVQFAINDAQPCTYATNIGVPQGSALSPILYIIYNSKAFEIIRKHGCIPNGYADDLTISTHGMSTTENASKLSRTLEALHQYWCIPYGQMLASEKSHVMHFIKPNTKEILKNDRFKKVSIDFSGGSPIQPVESTRYLGVILDEKLNFKKHVSQRVAKLNQVAGALTK